MQVAPKQSGDTCLTWRPTYWLFPGDDKPGKALDYMMNSARVSNRFQA